MDAKRELRHLEFKVVDLLLALSKMDTLIKEGDPMKMVTHWEKEVMPNYTKLSPILSCEC